MDVSSLKQKQKKKNNEYSCELFFRQSLAIIFQHSIINNILVILSSEIVKITIESSSKAERILLLNVIVTQALWIVILRH